MALLMALAATPPSRTAYLVAAQYGEGASDLDLAAAYLPFADGSEPVAFVTSLPRNAFFIWTVHEQCRCRVRVEQLWSDHIAAREAMRQFMADWLADTTVRRIVLVRPFRPVLDAAAESERLAGILDAMAAQTRFRREATVAVPSWPAEIGFWQASGDGTAP